MAAGSGGRAGGESAGRASEGNMVGTATTTPVLVGDGRARNLRRLSASAERGHEHHIRNGVPSRTARTRPATEPQNPAPGGPPPRQLASCVWRIVSGG